MIKLQLARFDLGKVEKIVDQSEQGVGRALNRIKILPLFASDVSRQRQFRHADDGIHRGADLVTDVGEELAFRASGFLGVLPGNFKIARVHAQSIFRLLALDKLAELAADRAHHSQQLRVGLLDLVAKEFEYTQDLGPEEDRESKSCMQALLGRDRCAGKVWLPRHIFYPGGLGLRPDSAREAYARRKNARARTSVELFELSRWLPPCLHTAQQLLLLVNLPNSPHGPIETLTNSLQDPRSGAAQGRRIGENACNRILRGLARLFALPFCDIRRDAVDQSPFRADNGRPQKPSVGAVFTSVAILERKCAAPGCDARCFGDSSLTVIGVYELNVRTRE
jgi:hypothetical protein